jgi:hypothetical protein
VSTNEWDDKTKKLLDAIRGAADRALARPQPEVPAGVVNSQNAVRIHIESGRDDLVGNAGTIFRILNGLADREREAAFRALYFLIRGTHWIAANALFSPHAARHAIDAANAEFMRHRRRKHPSPRAAAIDQAIAVESRRKVSAKEMLDRVNKRLDAAGHKKGISARTLARRLERARHS